MPIDNFGFVESRDGELGSLSRSAQPSKHIDYYTLREDLKVDVVFKLNYEVKVPEKPFIRERPILPQDYKHQMIDSIVNEIHEERLKGHNVHIHCTYGRDRTGVVAAYYRIAKQGWSIEEAWDEMKEYGVTDSIHDQDKLIFLREEFAAKSGAQRGSGLGDGVVTQPVSGA